MSGTSSQQARRRDPYPWTWELPLSVVLLVLLVAGLAAHLGRAVANRAAGAGWVQAGYEIRYRRGGAIEQTQVDSPDQILVEWCSSPLTSREQVAVSVRVTGTDGSRSAWSPETQLEAGLLTAERGEIGRRGVRR